MELKAYTYMHTYDHICIIISKHTWANTSVIKNTHTTNIQVILLSEVRIPFTTSSMLSWSVLQCRIPKLKEGNKQKIKKQKKRGNKNRKQQITHSLWLKRLFTSASDRAAERAHAAWLRLNRLLISWVLRWLSVHMYIRIYIYIGLCAKTKVAKKCKNKK